MAFRDGGWTADAIAEVWSTSVGAQLETYGIPFLGGGTELTVLAGDLSSQMGGGGSGIGGASIGGGNLSDDHRDDVVETATASSRISAITSPMPGFTLK